MDATNQLKLDEAVNKGIFYNITSAMTVPGYEYQQGPEALT